MNNIKDDSPESVAQQIVVSMIVRDLEPDRYEGEFNADALEVIGDIAAALRARDEAHAEEVERLRTSIELGWGIIANVSNGAWASQNPEWVRAATDWRNNHWHRVICDITNENAALAPAKEAP